MSAAVELGAGHPPVDMWLEWLSSSFDFIDRSGSKGQRGVLRVRKDLVLPVIRSIDSDDVIVGPGLYELSMEVMKSSRRRALYFVGRYTRTGGEWLADEQVGHGGVFLHHVGDSSDGLALARPKHLDGCSSPGLRWFRDGAAYSDRAIQLAFKALGGWQPQKRFRLHVV